MMKFKLLLLCFFIFLNTTAQNPNSQILDSLKNIYIQNAKLHKKLNPKEYSLLFHNLLSKIDAELNHLSNNSKRKNLKKTKNNLDEIKNLKALSILEIMLYGYNVRGNLDSINYYRQKIELLTNDNGVIGKSYGITAYTYRLQNNYLNAIKNYNKAIQFYKNSKDREIQYKQIHVLVNLNACLIATKNITIAKKNLKELEKTILRFPENPRFKNLKELIKIIQSEILVEYDDSDQAIKILKTVNTKNLDLLALRNRYYYVLKDAYFNVGNYLLAEYTFDKLFPEDSYKGLDYYYFKLQYANANKNIEKSDNYFNEFNNVYKINSTAKIPYTDLSFEYQKNISDYYILKKDFRKAYQFLENSKELNEKYINKEAKVKFEVYSFYSQIANELEEMKRLNELKDQKIIDNQLMYIKIGVTILLVIIIILIFVEWAARKKRYLATLKQISQRSILEAKEHFLENMSHEIRTPITSILGYLSLLKEENLILDKRLNFTNSAIDNTKKMMTSLDNFLNLTSLEGSSEFKNVKTSIKINDFIKEIKSTFSANLEIKKIKLYFKTNAEDSLIINYDIESLTIIVNNLISNAIKYSNSNTSIYFTMYFEKSKLRIMVKDEGFGISDDEKNNIFSRFYQTESNTSNSGFGIGLSLTNNLIKKLNGTIDLETKLNVGSVFKVEVPLIIDNYNLNTTQINKNFNLICSNTSTELEIDKNNNLPKALVVDDNTEMIIYLKEIFSNFLNCTFAFNGKEALNKINEQSFDIIISDVKMPIMNGIEFKNALNKQATSKNIPFIFMTSLIKDKTKDIDLLSFEDYIEKPFKKDEIISRIQFALEKTLNRKKLTSTIDSEIEFDSSSSELIKKVKNCILENLTNPDFTVISLCDLCGYGQKKLNEILKSKIGLSIVNTILEIRLLKAYDLIIKNRYETLKEVVYAVGINSRPYFNKKFELRFGIKPGDLRKKYKNLI